VRVGLGGMRRLAWVMLGACAVLVLAWAADFLWLILPRVDLWRADITDCP